MNPTLTALFTAATTIPLAAQTLPTSSTLPRGEHRLTGNYINVNTHGFGSWRLAAPKQLLPAGVSGIYPTAQVAYAVYLDKDAQNQDALHFRRTVNGGYTWQAPQVLYSLAANELMDSVETRILAFGYEVFVVFATNGPSFGSGQSCWAIASPDEGQSWTAPVRVSAGVGTTLFDVDEVNAAVARAATSGPASLHIVYEADYPASGVEDLYYAQLSIQGGVLAVVVPEQRLTWSIPAMTHDVNFTDIAAQGPVVHVVWTDNRALGGTGQYDYFSMTSRNGGADWALVNQYRHTTFTAPLSWADPRRPHAAVDVPHVYTFMEHALHGKDDVWMDWSNDVGQTFAYTGARVNTATLGAIGDIDDFFVVANGGRVAVVYVDDRLNLANNNDNNQAIVSVSHNAGMDFVNATHTEVPLSTLDPNPIFGIDMTGDLVAVVYETRCGTGQEDLAMSLSSDGGRTFTHHNVTQWGQCGLRTDTTDVDDPRMVLTMNGDCLAIWIDDRNFLGHGLGNTSNHVWTTGIHYPQLLDLTASNQGLRFQDASPRRATDLVFVLGSASGTGTPWNVNNQGFSLNMTHDLWTTATIGGALALPPGPPNLNLALCGSNGAVQFPGIPNVARLLGIPFWAAALTIGPSGLGDFTDPIRFVP